MAKAPRLRILPFAEIYTVIDLVSIDSRSGWCESPVHLEGHRLVHDRLVGRVPRERSARTAVLRRGSRGLPRRVWRIASPRRTLQTSRRAHRPRRQGGG